MSGSSQDENSNRSKTDEDEESDEGEALVKRSLRNKKNKVKYSSEEDEEDESEENNTDDYEESDNETNSDDSSSSSDSSDSDYYMKKKTRKKPVKKKVITRLKQKQTSTKHTTRSNKKVNYCEDDQDDETDTDDMIYKYEDEEEEKPKQDDNPDAETIEKVLKHRVGRVGAVGSKTAIYNVEEYGDPNGNLKPDEATEPQYLIKWEGWSHLHNTWESKETLIQQKVKGYKKLENYLKKEEENRILKIQQALTPEDLEYFDCQSEMLDNLLETHSNVERVIADNVNDYLCKWQGLPYSECTWEDGELIRKRFPKLIEEFEKRQSANTLPPVNVKNQKALRVRPKFVTLKEKPGYLGKQNSTPENPLTLRDYQLDGLNWLANSWCKQNGVILADEMGLGKTVQAISFLSYVFNEHNLYGPFLIVIPLSTIQGWQREFQKWAPEINFVIYLGDSQSRSMIQKHEWHLDSKKIKCNAILTTYEILLKDKAFFNSVSWAALVVDEAHRLKNEDSLLYRTLIKFDTNHRLLVTGTPLQNSLKELWALLHFIMPEKFNQWDEFDMKYSSVLKDGLKFQDLHRELEPYLLRRVKKDVEKSLPSKVEQILRVEMTKQQKQYYKLILTKNYKELLKGSKGNVSTFLNIMMELKKCSNHTYLIRRDEEKMNESKIDCLIRGSGKLFLLDKLLRRLKETGHRVLIFSQMVRMLDIIAEYLQYRRFSFQRLDGSIKGEIRRQALDHFNKPDSDDFCFLLSTRAGGLGINLSTADTVIIYDSDWNPQNDLQAQARAHRIGQKNQVNIYRLVTKNSIEEDIVERAKQKMVLDHLVIQRMDTTGRTVLTNTRTQTTSNPFTKEEINSILKFGAEELFKEESESKNDDKDYDIDEILKRAETREETNHLSASEELLSQFKVANFSTMEDDKTWNDIIPESERKRIDLEEETEQLKLISETRRNRTPKVQSKNSDESEFDSANSSDSEVKVKLKKSKLKSQSVQGLTSSEIRRFIKSYRKFPCPLQRIDTIAQDAQLEEKSQACLIEFATKMQQLCQIAIEESKDKKDVNLKKGPIVDINGVKINAQQILDAEKYFEPLAHFAGQFDKFNFKTKLKQAYWDCEWSNEDDRSLLKGVLEHGYGNWESIKSDPSLNLTEKILITSAPKEGEKEPVKLKPQSKHLRTRIDYLIKVLQNQINVEKYGKNWKEILNGGSKRKLKNNGAESDESDNHSDSSDKQIKKKRTNSADDLAHNEIEANHENAEEQETPKANKVKVRKNAPKKDTDKKEDKSKIELTDKIFNECKNILRPVKKALKSLNELDSTKDFEEIKKQLLEIGDKINDHLTIYSDPEKINLWRNYLWVFVSKFTTKWNWEKIKNLYKKFSNSRDQDLYAQPPPPQPQPPLSSHSSSQSSSGYYSYPSSSHHSHHNNSYNNKNSKYYDTNHKKSNNNDHHNQSAHHSNSYHSWKSDKNDTRGYSSKPSKEYTRSRDRDFESNNWEMDPNSKMNNFYSSSKYYTGVPTTHVNHEYQIQPGILGAAPFSRQPPPSKHYSNILNNSSNSPSSSPYNNFSRKSSSSSYRNDSKKFKEMRDLSPSSYRRDSHEHHHHHHYHH